jgi:hypothetical protein
VISHPPAQAQALARLARIVADTGDHDRAELFTHMITDPYWQANVLTEQARVVAAAGDRERARHLAIKAEQQARTIANPGIRANAVAELAKVAADTGDYDRAELLARTITEPDRQAQALTDLAQAVADAAPGTARLLTVEALLIGRWTIPATLVGRLHPQALTDLVDECVLGQPRLSHSHKPSASTRLPQ